MKRFRAAIIGHTGSGDYGHGLDLAFSQLPQVEVVAVADPNSEGRRVAAARSGALRQYDEYQAMLRQERPELVAVASRHVDGHHAAVLAAAEAGVRGIYCEKPFARTLREADEMIAACEASGTVVAVAHQNRVIPYLADIRSRIGRGEIGTLRRIRARGKDDRRGGAEDLIVLGTHMLDLMRAVAGDPRWAWARLQQGDRDLSGAGVRPGPEGLGPLGGDNLTAQFEFDAGVHGSYESYAGRGSARQMGLWIEGTAGSITLHGSFAKQAWICRQPQWTPELGAAAWEQLRLPEWDLDPGGHVRCNEDLLTLANRRMTQDLIRSIETGAEHPSSARDARWAMEMYFGAAESHRLGRRVRLPLENRENPWELLARSG